MQRRNRGLRAQIELRQSTKSSRSVFSGSSGDFGVSQWSKGAGLQVRVKWRCGAASSPRFHGVGLERNPRERKQWNERLGWEERERGAWALNTRRENGSCDLLTSAFDSAGPWLDGLPGSFFMLPIQNYSDNAINWKLRIWIHKTWHYAHSITTQTYKSIILTLQQFLYIVMMLAMWPQLHSHSQLGF